MIERDDIDKSYDDDNDDAEESFDRDADISETCQPVTVPPSIFADCEALLLDKAIHYQVVSIFHSLLNLIYH